jgi:hypothetical protein
MIPLLRFTPIYGLSAEPEFADLMTAMHIACHDKKLSRKPAKILDYRVYAKISMNDRQVLNLVIDFIFFQKMG